jgi:hypothetical protein
MTSLQHAWSRCLPAPNESTSQVCERLTCYAGGGDDTRIWRLRGCAVLDKRSQGTAPCAVPANSATTGSSCVRLHLFVLLTSPSSKHTEYTAAAASQQAAVEDLVRHNGREAAG